MSAQSLWERYQAHLVRYNDLGIWLDISRMRFGEDFFDAMTREGGGGFLADEGAGGGRDRQPGREPDGGALLAQKSRAWRRRGIAG